MKTLKEKLLGVLYKARQEYRDSIDCQGGCDHDVGICLCQEVHDLDDLEAMIAELEACGVNIDYVVHEFHMDDCGQLMCASCDTMFTPKLVAKTCGDCLWYGSK